MTGTALSRALATVAAAVAFWVSPYADAADDPVVATVNGEEIHRSDALGNRGRLPANLRQVPDEMILPVLVNIAIDTKLLVDEARKQGLETDAEVQAHLARFENLILEQVILDRYVKDRITDEALQERYEAMLAEQGASEQVRARHILVEQESQAEAVIEELRGGADFAELAVKRSIGPSAPKGGDLGYFGREEMVKEFADAAFALEVGAVTQSPVQTQFGWHVIKLEDRRKAEPPPFAQVSEDLRRQMMLDLRRDYVEELREEASIERFDESAPAPGSAPAPKE